MAHPPGSEGPEPIGGPPPEDSDETSASIPPAPESPRSLTDAHTVALAVGAAAGAWFHPPVPLLPGVLLVGLALGLRRPLWLVAGVILVASTLGTRAHDGLRGIEPGRHEGVVTLVSDPTDTAFGARADVRIGSKRVEARANRSAAGVLARALTGERLEVSGRLAEVPKDAPWLVPRHVVGVLIIERAEPVDAGAAPFRAANRFRRLLVRGAEAMPEPARSLYSGFVLGDGRGQGPEIVDDFRGAGLTHLLVVSGQNVAFVLLLVAPITSRLGLVSRWVVAVGVIVAFATVTRFEPSILRASAMAVVGVTAVASGRPSGPLRTLSLGVAGLILVDPLIVRSVAFQLSTAASLGIIVGAHRISARLGGPRWWRDLLGVTLAAQLGVAPVLVPRFGAMPVVAIPANLLAVPVSGLITTWGLPAGIVAGVFGPDVGAVAHWPTERLVSWVAGVARVAASLPLGEIDGWGLIGAGAGAWVASLRASSPRLRGGAGPSRPWETLARTLGLGLLVVCLLGPAVALRSPSPQVRPTEGAVLHRAGGATVLVLEGRPWVPGLLEGLRRAGVRRLDVVVSPDPAPALDRVLGHRWPVRRWVVPGHAEPFELRVGGLSVSSNGEQVTVTAVPP